MNLYDRIINILLESRIEDYIERLDERRRSRNRGIPRDGSAPVEQTPEKRAQAKAASRAGRPKGGVKVKRRNKEARAEWENDEALEKSRSGAVSPDPKRAWDRTNQAMEKAGQHPHNQPKPSGLDHKAGDPIWPGHRADHSARQNRAFFRAVNRDTPRQK